MRENSDRNREVVMPPEGKGRCDLIAEKFGVIPAIAICTLGGLSSSIVTVAFFNQSEGLGTAHWSFLWAIAFAIIPYCIYGLCGAIMRTKLRRGNAFFGFHTGLISYCIMDLVVRY